MITTDLIRHSGDHVRWRTMIAYAYRRGTWYDNDTDSYLFFSFCSFNAIIITTSLAFLFLVYLVRYCSISGCDPRLMQLFVINRIYYDVSHLCHNSHSEELITDWTVSKSCPRTFFVQRRPIPPVLSILLFPWICTCISWLGLKVTLSLPSAFWNYQPYNSISG